MHNVLTFHPEAEEYFNSLGRELRSAVEKHPERQSKSAETRSWFQPHSAGTIQHSEIIEPIKIGKTDYFGNPIAKYFHVGQDLYGLSADDHSCLMKLADHIHSVSSFHNATTYESVVDTIFEWVEQSHLGKTELELCRYMIEQLSKTIDHHEVWVPIANLAVETNLTLGTVTFVPITSGLLDAWQKRWTEQRPDDKEHINQYYSNLRKTYQGWTAGMVRVTAESRRVQEIAIADVDRALALLRFFSPANFSPQINCISAVLGRQLVRTETTFDIFDNALNKVDSRTDKSDTFPWLVNTKLIGRWKKELLPKLSELHSIETSNQFHATLSNSLMLYSKVSTAKEIADKLVYLFASVESILLKDSREPIQYAVGDRMATLLGGSIDNKKQIISNFRSMYGKRSKLIHHAESVGLTNELSELMRNVWMTFFCIIKEMHSFNSKKEFVERLDDRKLSGSM